MTSIIDTSMPARVVSDAGVNGNGNKKEKERQTYSRMLASCLLIIASSSAVISEMSITEVPGTLDMARSFRYPPGKTSVSFLTEFH